MLEIKQYVRNRKEYLKEELSKLDIVPTLLIIQVNHDEASNAYIKGKIKDASEIGFIAKLLKLDENISELELLEEINKANKDNSIHGIIVQMPLPKHINPLHVKMMISVSKDVDGFHPLSRFEPCTPLGIINYLKANDITFSGKNAVVIGRSDIVGKPMAKLLLKENCNVTVLHSKTTQEDMAFYIAHADIIVIAIGKAGFLDNSFTYKNNAIIVDVGINRIDGKLYGDAIKDLPVSLQTPVPGGVGLLTRLTLLENLMEATKHGF